MINKSLPVGHGREGNRWVRVRVGSSNKNRDDDNLEGNNASPKQSKTARKKKRRKERRRLLEKEQQKQQQQAGLDSNENNSLGENAVDEDETLARALEASLESNSNSTHGDQRLKRLRKLRKKLSEARSLASKPEAHLENEQRRKVAQIPSYESEIQSLEEQLESERAERLEQERQAHEALKRANQKRMAEWKAFSNGNIVQGFGGKRLASGNASGDDVDEFACPLCAGPLEAAVKTSNCHHVFCRACLEEALESAAVRTHGEPSSIVCPICRSCLLDSSTIKVTVEADLRTRRKMKKKKCTCRCGTEMSLASLRIHLRTCTEGAPILFGNEVKRSGHEQFKQPTLDPVKVQRWSGKKVHNSHSAAPADGGVPEGYDEEAEIQTAILLSLCL